MFGKKDMNTDFPPKDRAIGMLTDVGRVRKIDEDSIMVAEISLGIDSKITGFKLLVVADGMGGHARGEQASKMALNAISRAVIPRLFDDISPAKLLADGIKYANQDILDHVKTHPEASGMGTTAVCALVCGNDVYIASIGDSRAYVISENEIRRVTRDHSYVQELIDNGDITEEESRTHPRKNVITKAIGAAQTIEPDTMCLTLALDEYLVLCCDGVVAHMTDEDIHNEINDVKEPQKACKQIVDMINKRGGSDNISLIILSNSGLCQ